MELAEILRQGAARGASDFHLRARQRPIMRVQGRLAHLDTALPLEPKDLEQMAGQIMSPIQKQRYDRDGGVDIQYHLANVGRFRVSICRSRGAPAIAMRVVPFEPPGFAELHLPAVIEKLAMEERGLFLVTGPAGSGKTTTLAAMVHHMNQHRNDHIVCIEDPIEYLFADKNCVITQREVGTDTPSFAEALRICLRQDPNVIMVGEMRDLETVSTVLTLAETGHLVLSTLHTITAAETVNRIITEFPGHQERQVRGQLSQVLRGIVSQRLIQRADGSGLILAAEILVSTSTIQRCIEDPGRTAQIPSAIAEGRDIYGMQTFDQCVLDYYQKGIVTYEEALRAATSPTDFEVEVQRLSMNQGSPLTQRGGPGTSASGTTGSRVGGRPPAR